MSFDEKRYDKIQKYLDGTLKGNDLKTFESEMGSDKQLDREVKLNADMQEMLADTPENNLRKSLQALSDEVPDESKNSRNFNRNWFWLLPIVFAVGLWFFISGGQKNKNSTNSEIPPAILNKDSTETDTPPRIRNKKIKEMGPNLEGLSPEEIKELEEELNRPPVKTDPTDFQDRKGKIAEEDSSQTNSGKNELIAANFEPNPNLDFLIDNNVRNGDFELTVKKQPSSFKIKSDAEKVNFDFSAILKIKDDLSNSNFNIHIFSNKPSDFEDFLPLSTTPVNLEKSTADSYEIIFRKQFSLTPGLYYYLLEDVAEERIYFIDKFVVRD